MAPTKATAASKDATKPGPSKKTKEETAPTTKGNAKVKKATKKTAARANREPTPYNVFFKTNYARIKSENPELLSKEMMAKIAEVWRLEPTNPKSPNYTGPAAPKTATK